MVHLFTRKQNQLPNLVVMVLVMMMLVVVMMMVTMVVRVIVMMAMLTAMVIVLMVVMEIMTFITMVMVMVATVNNTEAGFVSLIPFASLRISKLRSSGVAKASACSAGTTVLLYTNVPSTVSTVSTPDGAGP